MPERGEIIVYSTDAKSGVIKTGTGVPLYFSFDEWQSKEVEPKSGMAVEFTQGFYAAKDVRIILSAKNSD